MKTKDDPAVISVGRFCESGGIVRTATPLATMARLAESFVDGSADVGPWVNWEVRGWQQSNATRASSNWIQVQADLQAHMTCQRCLEPVQVALHVDRLFRFVSTEAQALSEDAESDEDILVMSTRLDLAGLIEDELLLSIPMVPVHDDCTPAGLGPADDALTDVPRKRNPFGVLSALKRSAKADGEL